jgi:hypothetical protein
MTTKVEVQEGSYVTVSDEASRKIIEQLMSLCENMENMTDDDMVCAIEELQTLLNGFGLLTEETQEGIRKYEEMLRNHRGDDEYDGQPDEAQEWHDFDPDC